MWGDDGTVVGGRYGLRGRGLFNYFLLCVRVVQNGGNGFTDWTAPIVRSTLRGILCGGSGG